MLLRCRHQPRAGGERAASFFTDLILDFCYNRINSYNISIYAMLPPKIRMSGEEGKKQGRAAAADSDLRTSFFSDPVQVRTLWSQTCSPAT